MKATLRARTVRFNKSTEIDGKDGQKVKVVYFTVADRETRKAADNSYVTKGFYFCKAYGKTAELIERDFSKTDENGKLISRKIFLEVEPQTYKDEKEVEVKMNIPAGKLFAAFGMPVDDATAVKNIELVKKEKVEVINTVYLVKEFDYDDNKLEETSSASEDVTINIGDAIPAEVITYTE